MSKPWRNPRGVIVHLAPVEPEDRERAARLIALLATGMERLLSTNTNEALTLLDFIAKVSPNTRNVNDPEKTENL